MIKQKPSHFERSVNINDIDAIKIMLASPDKVREWSFGEVVKPETINYRTFKPERDGLFCAKIFGPVNDWECSCGKYKRMKYKGVVCERCGVEVTQAKVRRERMGHIDLASPVSHIWFFKGPPSRIGYLLDLTAKELERVLYFESYVVCDPGDDKITGLKLYQIVTEEEARKLRAEKGEAGYVLRMGAEAVRDLLSQIDMDTMAEDLRARMKIETSVQKRLKLSKRLKVVEAFRNSGNRPEWMVLTQIPVIPPELRPLVPLDGGRFASSDLNDLYRRVINRNNRLKRLLELHAPEVIIRNEKRMLQESVDALFDNGRRGRTVKGQNNRPLKSLSDTLKGKQGRFRQNLLGKRVDYSGRSVIVVGPELKLNQCGLPKKMALELFKPFIYNELEKRGIATTIKQARELVEAETPEVYDALDLVVKSHPVLLNRAPTLHRLGIQAFEPVLVEGKAIRIHPLVCAAFNADFDGDQMAVHVPLSPIAQIEAHTLMMSTNNLLLPASGRPIIVPSQDIVLGIYYLTKSRPGRKGEGHVFANVNEVLMAYELGLVEVHTRIKYRYRGNYMNLEKAYDNQDIVRADVTLVDAGLIDTTAGRVIFNDVLPAGFPFMNGVIKKKGLESLFNYVVLRHGRDTTVTLADAVKNLGFVYATRSGVSVGIEDMLVPDNKEQLLAAAQTEVNLVHDEYKAGAITNRERYNKVVTVWNRVTEEVAEAMFKKIEAYDQTNPELNSIYIMADSGARGSKQQMRQLAGMRGLMAKPSGEIIEQPITANFREGLTVLQYFISSHGARKGLADTALKTADSGYLTRRLVDVAQDLIVTEEDCHTLDGLYIEALVEGGEIVEPLRERILGRVLLEDVVDPENTKIVLAKQNEEITEDLAQRVQESGVEKVKIRSVLTCETRYGICVRCYGRNLGSGRMVELGEAVGVIAAQSIGEPGTQLTMRTFHIGGTASQQETQSSHVASTNGLIRFHAVNTITTRDGSLVSLNRSGFIAILDEKGHEREKFPVNYGARLKVKDGEKAKKGTLLVEWDPYSNVIIADIHGVVNYQDIKLGATVREEVDEATGYSQQVVIETKDQREEEPGIVLQAIDADGKKPKVILLPVGAHIVVREGGEVYPGDVLAKIPRESAKTRDIVGGLPRVVELFEARRPKTSAVITHIDGKVHYGEITKNYRKLFIIDEATGEQREYAIPKGKHINVVEGESVRVGDKLVDGPVNPHDILEVLGEKELQKYLVNEVQEVYRGQGVSINDKHLETIIRQMMRWVQVEDIGDTDFLIDQNVDRFAFQQENERVLAKGGTPARCKPLLLGITKAALNSDSWISAASFQETTRVLTAAAIEGQVDALRGLKENVIMGRLIPAGTGFDYYRKVKVEADDTIPVRVNEEEKAMQELTADLFALREKIGADDDDDDDEEDLDATLPPVPPV